MSKNICFIGNANKSLNVHLDLLVQKDYTIHSMKYELENFDSFLRKNKIKLVLIYHKNEEKNFYKNFASFFNTKKQINFIQKIPIIVFTSSRMDVEPKYLEQVVDDIIFLPINQSKLLKKIEAWLYLGEEKGDETNWSKRTFILEDKIEQVRKNLRRGNFGLAISNLSKVRMVLESFDDKQVEVERLSNIFESINTFLEKGQTLPLVSQLNAIEISPLPLEWETVISDLVTDQDDDDEEIVNEGMTTALPMDEFLEYRKSNHPQEKSTTSKRIKENRARKETLSHISQKINKYSLDIHKDDQKFAKALLKRKIISKQQLENALNEQISLEKNGEEVRLYNIMLNNGVIHPMDIAHVFGKNAIAHYYCADCNLSYRVLNIDTSELEKFSCRRCKNQIREAADSGEIFVVSSSHFIPDIHSDDIGKVTSTNIPWALGRAAILAKNKKIEESLYLYSKILEIDPRNEACRVGRSRLFIENKAYSNAIDEANEILVHNPDNFQMLCHRGVARYYTGELDNCIKDLGILIEKGIHNFMSYSTRGKAYYRQKKYNLAIADLTEAIIRSPDFVKGYIYRGRAYLHLKKNKLAIADFKEALSINPKFPNQIEVKKLISIAKQRDKKN